MIRCILLDVHGVLTDGKERKRMIAQMARKYGMDRAKHNRMWVDSLKRLDFGVGTPKQYVNAVNEAFGTKFTVSRYYGFFLRNIVVNRELLRRLRNAGRIVVVSDNIAAVAPHLGALLGPEFRRFKKFYSYRYGKTKMRGLFKVVLRSIGCAPDECVFIDDKVKKVRIARRLGIHAIRFKNNRQLFSEMRKYGIRI